MTSHTHYNSAEVVSSILVQSAIFLPSYAAEESVRTYFTTTVSKIQPLVDELLFKEKSGRI